MAENNRKKKTYRILIVGAHHEETEAELPNTAAALAMAGCRVHILNPVGGWNWTFIRSLGKDGRERTIDDALRAARELGCEKTVWDYPIAQAHRHEPEIMDRMAGFLLDFEPDIVLMHWHLDTNADHRLIARITRHILDTAVNISPDDHPDFRPPCEVYAFQTGVAQAYNFFPDLLVLADRETMKRSEKAVRRFMPTASCFVPAWEKNFRTKADYWGNLAGQPAEALKFLGPVLPLEGFLLKKILGKRLIAAPLDSFRRADSGL